MFTNTSRGQNGQTAVAKPSDFIYRSESAAGRWRCMCVIRGAAYRERPKEVFTDRSQTTLECHALFIGQNRGEFFFKRLVYIDCISLSAPSISSSSSSSRNGISSVYDFLLTLRPGAFVISTAAADVRPHYGAPRERCAPSQSGRNIRWLDRAVNF
jgi:hypothetical protein